MQPNKIMVTEHNIDSFIENNREKITGVFAGDAPLVVEVLRVIDLYSGVGDLWKAMGSPIEFCSFSLSHFSTYSGRSKESLLSIDQEAILPEHYRSKIGHVLYKMHTQHINDMLLLKKLEVIPLANDIDNNPDFMYSVVVGF